MVVVLLCMLLTDNRLAFEVTVSANVFPPREVLAVSGVVGVRPVAVLVDREGDPVTRQLWAAHAEILQETVILLLLTPRALEAAPPVVVPAPVVETTTPQFLLPRKISREVGRNAATKVMSVQPDVWRR